MADPTTTPLVDRLRAQAARHREHATGLASAALLEEAADMIDLIVSPAARDVLAERRRQIEVKGRTAEHDDAHVNGEIISEDWGAIRRMVAASAWLTSGLVKAADAYMRCYRDLLVESAAMVIAEIERIDRAAEREAGR